MYTPLWQIETNVVIACVLKWQFRSVRWEFGFCQTKLSNASKWRPNSHFDSSKLWTTSEIYTMISLLIESMSFLLQFSKFVLETDHLNVFIEQLHLAENTCSLIPVWFVLMHTPSFLYSFLFVRSICLFLARFAYFVQMLDCVMEFHTLHRSDEIKTNRTCHSSYTFLSRLCPFKF